MTRDEAIKRQMKATGFTEKSCAGFVDQMAGIGMLKLDEPKSAWEKFAKVMVEDFGYSKAEDCPAATLNSVLQSLLRAGLKIVEK